MAAAVGQRLRRGDPEMVAVDLRGEPLVGGPLALLADALATTRSPLVRLDLSGTRLGDAGVDQLARGLATLRSVDACCLQYNALGDAGAASLAWLLRGAEAGGAGHPLASLDLAFNAVGSAGAQALGEALRTNDALTSLFLNSNKLGDAGGAALARALGEPDHELFRQAALLAAAAAHDAAFSAKIQANFLWLHRRNRGLTHLNLCSNGLGQATTAMLTTALRENPCLAGEAHNNMGIGAVRAV
jgi:Ran GTPase-activating protein (RanGAP) involved in mRNA processing and transport